MLTVDAFFTSLMNENLFSCLIWGGGFFHITVALYEIVCFPVFVLRPFSYGSFLLRHILCCCDEHLWHIADMCQRCLVMPLCANDEQISKYEVNIQRITVALYEIVCFPVFVLRPFSNGSFLLRQILCCCAEHLWHIADMCQRYLVMPSCANDEQISKYGV